VLLARYRQTKALSRTDAAYIAGLIDGEGTVTLTRKHKNDYRRLAVSISSNERPMLEFVLERTGVGWITNKRKNAKHHASSYNWSVYNRQALDLLRQVAPHLKSYKKHRAQLILENYLNVTPRNGKYTEVLLAKKQSFEDKVLAINASSNA
jgi:spermidine/putrescine-binding protein